MARRILANAVAEIKPLVEGTYKLNPTHYLTIRPISPVDLVAAITEINQKIFVNETVELQVFATFYRSNH